MTGENMHGQRLNCYHGLSERGIYARGQSKRDGEGSQAEEEKKKKRLHQKSKCAWYDHTYAYL